MNQNHRHTSPLIKVCGMCREANARAVAALMPDFLGFIFFEKSPRHAGDVEQLGWVQHLPKGIKKVGVFVNEAPEWVLTIVETLGLDAVQLHGDESPEYCAAMAKKGLTVWKAFGVGAGFSFGKTAPYEPHCQYFVFDAKGPQRGGNGVPFDWNLLGQYAGQTPFLLSGGLGPEHGLLLRNAETRHPRLIGFDLNSRFETSPGLKDPGRLKLFFDEIKH
ncbi:MAG: N-(5'-phosphoribosyl)anthranilate isomerase [Saprospirales bacterium]|nr:N-(5'-phosphoribosyl)anthranilate isomerase [Saprospirales bacterium]